MSGDQVTGVGTSEHRTKSSKMSERQERHRKVYLKLRGFFFPKGAGFSFSFDGKVHTLVVSKRVAELFGWKKSRFTFTDPEQALRLIEPQA